MADKKLTYIYCIGTSNKLSVSALNDMPFTTYLD